MVTPPKRFQQTFSHFVVPCLLMLASVGFTFLILFGAAEIYFRRCYPSSAVADTGLKTDPFLGWDSSGSVLPMPLNGNHLVSVYFLGDSFTDRKKWTTEAQRIATDKGSAFDGYNLGVTGYGTTQEFLKLQRDFDLHRPKLVVLLLYAWNDLRDNDVYPRIFYGPQRQSRPYFLQEDGTFVLDPTHFSWTKSLLSTSEVYLRVISRVSLKFSGAMLKHYPDLYRILHWSREVYYDEPAAWSPFYRSSMQETALVRGAYDATMFSFSEMNRFLGSHGSTLLVVGIDNAFTVDEDVAVLHLKHFPDADPLLPLQKISILLGQQGVAFINAQPELLSLHRRSGRKVYNGPIGNLGGHLEPEADALIGRIVGDWIAQQIRR